MTLTSELDNTLLEPIRVHLRQLGRYVDLVWWYDLGCAIRKWKTAAGMGKHSPWVAYLVKEFADDNLSDDRIRRPFRFAQNFDRKTVRRLANMGVNWSHIRKVVGGEAAQKAWRIELLEKAAANGWNPQDLALEIRRQRAARGVVGREAVPNPARKSRHPSDHERAQAAANGITRLCKESLRWKALATRLGWADSIDTIVANPKKFTREFEGIAGIATEAEQNLGELIRIAKSLKTKLAKLNSRLAATPGPSSHPGRSQS